MHTSNVHRVICWNSGKGSKVPDTVRVYRVGIGKLIVKTPCIPSQSSAKRIYLTRCCIAWRSKFRGNTKIKTFGLKPKMIDVIDRVILNILIQVQAITETSWVTAGPTSQPGCVIPYSKVIEAGFFIPLLTRKPVSFHTCFWSTSENTIRTGSMRMKLFIGNDSSRVICFYARRIQKVWMLITNQIDINQVGWIAIINIKQLSIYLCNSPMPIRNMNSSSLQFFDIIVIFPVKLNYAQINPFNSYPWLTFNYFSSSCSIWSIGVERHSTTAQINTHQLVGKIPAQTLQMRHFHHIPMWIMLINRTEWSQFRITRQTGSF